MDRTHPKFSSRLDCALRTWISLYIKNEGSQYEKHHKRAKKIIEDYILTNGNAKFSDTLIKYIAAISNSDDNSGDHQSNNFKIKSKDLENEEV